MDFTSPLMFIVYVVGGVVALVLALIGMNFRANRRRRAKLVDAMQRSRFGRTSNEDFAFGRKL